ncbi:MAG: transposase domain-containing protein [Candidatus Gastranaerophilaceae bacterium]|nr:transposase domain-containing protein [Candidatus Gastranaerophilaceae bacterium]
MQTEVWLTVDEVCNLSGEIRETVRRKCKKEIYVSRFIKQGKFKIYYILLKSLPEEYQTKYFESKEHENRVIDISNGNEEYALAPEWARKQADKYMEILSLTEKMSYKEIVDFLKIWNTKNPNKKLCYHSVYRAKKIYNQLGIAGLLCKKGYSSKGYSIKKEYLDYYKSLYLKEGAPSANSCWRATLGYAIELDNINPIEFPSCRTFDRYIRKEIPEQAIYLARFGQAAWNKKYAMYIPRDYTKIVAGSCWVSDHAQIDIAVRIKDNICFPWVTVFRDVKTSKWLGWFLHAESPNSDHIFQAFYYGVIRFGIPNDVYLDNGKDYRCRDFAGGRNSVRIDNLGSKENSLITNLGVSVHFALPYNAQTKPVERDFLKIKEFLSKGFVGYRGGKITERPEKLKKEIKRNQIMEFSEFKILFDDFVKNILNKTPSNGKILKGRCPDEAWAEEFAVKKIISKDALKLFCMRTSKSVKIGRNGVNDASLDVTYWADWMVTEKGRKVFLRRDINAYQEAWVFDAETEKYLGKANIYHETSFLAKTNIEKNVLKEAISNKRKEQKILKSYITSIRNVSNTKKHIEHTKLTLTKNYESNPAVIQLSNTKMDQVIKEEGKMNTKPEKYVTQLLPKKKLYLTEAERDRELAKQRAI